MAHHAPALRAPATDAAHLPCAVDYDTDFYVSEHGELIFDTLESVYDNIAKAVASATNKPISATIYPQS